MGQEEPLTYLAAIHEGQRLWKEIEALQDDLEVKREILELKDNRLRWLLEHVKTTYGEKIREEFAEEIFPNINEVTEGYDERIRLSEQGIRVET